MKFLFILEFLFTLTIHKIQQLKTRFHGRGDLQKLLAASEQRKWSCPVKRNYPKRQLKGHSEQIIESSHQINPIAKHNFTIFSAYEIIPSN